MELRAWCLVKKNKNRNPTSCQKLMLASKRGAFDFLNFFEKKNKKDEMIKRDDSLPGYAIGGLVGGEDKNLSWR